jgi:hypothetical protein
MHDHYSGNKPGGFPSSSACRIITVFDYPWSTRNNDRFAGPPCSQNAATSHTCRSGAGMANRPHQIPLAVHHPATASDPPAPGVRRDPIRLVRLRPFHSVAKREGKRYKACKKPPPLGSFSRASESSDFVFLSGSNQSVIIKAEGGFVLLLPCLWRL